MPFDTSFYDEALRMEAFGHVGLQLGQLHAAPRPGTIKVIEEIAERLAARDSLAKEGPAA